MEVLVRVARTRRIRSDEKLRFQTLLAQLLHDRGQGLSCGGLLRFRRRILDIDRKSIGRVSRKLPEQVRPVRGCKQKTSYGAHDVPR